MAETLLSAYLAIERHIAAHGVWEGETVYAIGACVQAGQRCVDVGANAGFHTLAMAKQVGPTGQVIAFEPNGLTFGRLTDNVNMNAGLRRIVRCEKMGLAARDQVMHVYQDGAHNAGNAYLAAGPTAHLSAVPDDSFELCLVTTLDGYLGGQQVDFVKIDVEGMEHAVLAGAAATLRRWQPTVYYETHLACFDHADIQRAGSLLEVAGYDLYRIEPDGRFVPAAYPHNGLDTLAIHPSRATAVFAR